MTTQEVKRKLAAILSADVRGYSRLMGEDEEWTVHTLNTYKDMMKGLIQQHRGRVVDAPGDNVLAEFASVVDAVQSSVEIQQVLRAKNAMLPENRRMEFRIGINLGDVIEEGEQIYGDFGECVRADREQATAPIRLPGGARGEEYCQAGAGLPGTDRVRGCDAEAVRSCFQRKDGVSPA